MLEKQNQCTFDASIFSDKIDPHEEISPRQNIQLILSDCDEFIYDFDQDNGKNLLFYGDTGLGKHLCLVTLLKNFLIKVI